MSRVAAGLGAYAAMLALFYGAGGGARFDHGGSAGFAAVQLSPPGTTCPARVPPPCGNRPRAGVLAQ